MYFFYHMNAQNKCTSSYRVNQQLIISIITRIHVRENCVMLSVQFPFGSHAGQ